MKSELSKRIAKFENRGFQAAEIRAAYRDYVEHGLTSKNPKLARIVERLHQTLAEMDASVPGAPEVAHEH